jgi:hypothetical protein
MSIILQHEFWDLVVTEEAFEVSLNFSRKPERLTVPFDAITGFTDPSVPFGFKLEPRVPDAPPGPAPSRSTALTRTPAAAKRQDAPPVLPAQSAPVVKASEQPRTSAQPPGEAKVVSIDAFRKK